MDNDNDNGTMFRGTGDDLAKVELPDDTMPFPPEWLEEMPKTSHPQAWMPARMIGAKTCQDIVNAITVERLEKVLRSSAAYRSAAGTLVVEMANAFAFMSGMPIHAMQICDMGTDKDGAVLLGLNFINLNNEVNAIEGEPLHGGAVFLGKSPEPVTIVDLVPTLGKLLKMSMEVPENALDVLVQMLEAKGRQDNPENTKNCKCPSCVEERAKRADRLDVPAENNVVPFKRPTHAAPNRQQ